MDLLRWGRSPWGEWVLTHVSWNLFWASLFAGVLFFVAHASYMLFSAHRKRSSAETDALEAAIVGKPRNEDTAKLAGDMAVEGAQTLRHNGYKVPLMRNLVKRAIRGAEGGAWTS